MYLGAGVDREKTALLCVVGAREDGVKELLGMELGYRESTETLVRCAEELEGSGSECAAIGGGRRCAGLWAALDAVFPTPVIRGAGTTVR